MQESLAVKTIAALHPLEVRYHCAFNKTDLGDVDSKKADGALKIFRRPSKIVNKAKMTTWLVKALVEATPISGPA